MSRAWKWIQAAACGALLAIGLPVHASEDAHVLVLGRISDDPNAHYAQLKPLLDRLGDRADLTLILFTLDESAYARELAPLAGHYPCLRLGPAWW